MKLQTRHFDTDFLDVWDGVNWLPRTVKGRMQVYDRFITDRTFGVKKRIFLTSYVFQPGEDFVRVNGTDQPYLVEAITPDLENTERFRDSVLIRITNCTVSASVRTPVVNAAGIVTGYAPASTLTTWGDIDRYNSGQSSEFSGVYHETDILVVPTSFSVTLDTPLTVNGVKYKIAEIGRVLRLQELRVRREA